MRYQSGLLFLAVASSVAVPAWAAGQAEATPPAPATGAPVTAGDWIFVADVERHGSFYSERLGQMFEPEGVFLIVGVQITYNEASPYNLGREYVSTIYRLAVDGEITDQAKDAYAAFAVEQTYLTDVAFPSARGMPRRPRCAYSAPCRGRAKPGW